MSSYIYENKTYKFIYLDAVSFTNENTKKGYNLVFQLVVVNDDTTESCG